MIELSRNKIYLSILAILLLLHFVPLIFTYSFNRICSGKIVQVLRSDLSYSNSNQMDMRTYNETELVIPCYNPIAEYTIGKLTYKLTGPTYYELEWTPWIDEEVTILYDPSEPEDAHFLNLSGFWFHHYLLMLFLLLVISVGLYHFLHPHQKLLIRTQPSQNEKYIELTKRPEDAKKRNLLNWINHSKTNRRR